MPASCRPLVVQSASDPRRVRTFQGPGSRRFLRVGQPPMLPTTGRSWPRPPMTNHRSGCRLSEQAGASPAVDCPARSCVAASGRSGLVAGLRRASDDTPMPAAVSGTGRGRGGSQPPPALSAVPSRPALRRTLAAQPARAFRRRERAWRPRLQRAPRVGRCWIPAALSQTPSGLVVSNVRRSLPWGNPDYS